MIKKKYLKQYLSSTHNIISAFVLTSPPSLSSLTALNPGNMSITKPPSGVRSALTRFATELFSFSSRWNFAIKKPPDGRHFFGDPSEVAAADALSSFHSDRLRRPLRADALCDRTLLVLIPLEFCHKKTARWAAFFGDPSEIRTRVTAVKGRCPGPLDDGVKKNGGSEGARTLDLLRDRQTL